MTGRASKWPLRTELRTSSAHGHVTDVSLVFFLIDG